MKVYDALKQADAITALLEVNGFDIGWHDYHNGDTIVLHFNGLRGEPSATLRYMWEKAYDLLTQAGYQCESYG